MPDTDIAFEPEIDFEPEGAAPPVPSVGDLIQRTQPWTSHQDASAQMERATGLNPSPTLPPASGRLSIAAPHQGTATQEAERQGSGILVPGNIDLANRPSIPTPGKPGYQSTELSFSRGTDQGEVLVPRVVNGKVLSEDEAWGHYKKTGEHMGIFDTPEHADAYANRAHMRAPGTTEAAGQSPSGVPLVLAPTRKANPLAPPPATQNQITPVGRPALGQPGAVPPVPAEPKQKVTLVSTGFGAPTWIANDGSMEAREQAAQLNASEGEAVRGVTGVSGYPKIAEGLKNLVPTATQPYPTRRQAMGAGAEVLGGVGEALTPAMITGAVAAPAATVGAIIGGVGAKKGAEALADHFQVSPEAKALIGEAAATVGAIGGGIAGHATGQAAANFKPIEDSLTTLLWKRGYVNDAKGQQMRILSESDARAAAQAILKTNPVSMGDAVRIWRESRTQQIAEPVEGEYVGEKPTPTTPLLTGNAPITRAEIAEAMVKTNYAGPEATAAQIQADRAAAVQAKPAEVPKPAVVKPQVPAPTGGRPAISPPSGPSAGAVSGGGTAPAAKIVPKLAEGQKLAVGQIDFKPEEVEVAKAEVPAKPAAVLPKPTAQPSAVAAKTEEVAKPMAAPVPQGAEQVAATPSEQPPVHKFGNTQANIPEGSEAHGALETARARISDSDLAGQGKNVEGNHVTVRYGIQGDDVEGIKKFLSEQAPFEATLGKTDVFPPSKSSDGAAVVMAPIEAPQLHRLNDEIQKHGEFTESTHPDYRPHATVAYVKPDAANRYKGMSVTAGKKFTIDSVVISHKDGTTEVVKLAGKAPVEFEPEEVEVATSNPPSTPAVVEAGRPEILQSEIKKLQSDYKAIGEKIGPVTGSYGPEKRALVEQANEVNRKIREREDELAKLRGEPTRAEKRDLQTKEAAKSFADRPKEALKYGDTKHSQHWQVLEPDYMAKRFEQKAATYERAITESQAELDAAKPGTKKHGEAQMNLDFRKKMLQRFKDKDPREAQSFRTEYLDLVKKAVSQGKPVPDAVIAQKSEFKLAQDARERYEKGRHTSFANKSAAINDTMQKEEGFKIKRQDGKPMPDDQAREISSGIADIVKVLGEDLRDMMRGTDLTIAHTNGKHPFLSDAGGMYHPVDRSISAGINDFLGRPVKALAHELGHWLDFESGRAMGVKSRIYTKGGKGHDTHYASEATISRALYDLARSTMTDTREVPRMLKMVKTSDLPDAERAEVERVKVILGPYWREPRELFARMFEQYIADELGKSSTAAEDIARYHKVPAWWSKAAWDKLKPAFTAELQKRIVALRDRYAPKAEETSPVVPASSVEKTAETKPRREVISTAKPEYAGKQQIKGTQGNETKLLTSEGEHPARYRVVEAAALMPSHNAQTFAKNAKYPEGVQERAYDTSKEAQSRVIEQAQKYDPNYTINTNPDAVNGPPVITPDGIVLGGNSRAMSTQRLYKAGNGNRYKSALLAQAQTFGLDKEAISLMKEPVLVREIAAPKTIDEMRAIGSQLNKSMTGALGVSERAVSAGKAITRDSLNTIAGFIDSMGEGASLRDAMRDRGSEIVSLMVKDGAITARERPQFIDTSTGGLSEEGKTFVERALLGSVVDDPRLMDSAPKSVLNKLDSSLAALASLAPRTDAYNILPVVREALRDHAEIANRGIKIEDYLAQGGLFGGTQREPAVDAIVRLLAEKPTIVKAKLRQFAQDANFDVQGQGMLAIGSQPSPSDAFKAAFGVDVSDKELENGIIRAAQSGSGAEGDRAVQGSTQEGAGSVQQPATGEARAGGEATPRTAETKPETELGRLFREEEGAFYPGRINPSRITKLYNDFISEFIDKKLDLGDKYRRVADHDPVIAKMLKEKDNAPRYFHDKAESNVEQVIKGLNEHQVRLAAMLSDSDAREHLEEHYPDQYDEARQDPAVMDAVNRFKQYQDQLAAIRIKLGWHVRRNLSTFEDEAGKWSVLDRNGDEVESFKSQKDAQDYVEANGNILDHLKRTYPEHLREPLMGRTDEGPSLGASHGGIRPPRPDRKQRLATADYFYTHGAKDFSGYVKSYTQAYHAALNQKIYDSLTDEATKWKEGTARPPQIEYRGKTYYSPDVAKSMKLAAPANRPKTIQEYRAYDPAKDDKAMIRDFENGWSTQTTGRPGISPSDRYLAPVDVVDALEHYDMTRGQQENDSIRRFFQDQIVGLFGPNIHVLNIMRRLSHVVGSGPWDPRVWPYYQKLFFSKELRDRMADGLADDAIDALSKWGTYTNTRDIGSLHTYVLGNMNPANWVRQTVGKFSKGVLFDPKFLGGFGGLDQKSRVLAYDFLHDRAGMGEEEASKNVEDGFGNYNKSNWSERMKRWARALLFPGWDFSSLKWFLRHPIKTALYPALVTMGVNLALNAAGKNKDGDKYDFAYLHYGDRKLRTGLITESMALHIATPVFEAARAALEGGDSRDIARAAWSGALRGGGGLAGVLRPEIQAAAELLSNRQYMGGTKEIWKPEDAAVPGKVAPTRHLDKALAFSVVKAFPAISRFLDSSYDNVDLATGVGSIIGVTNYKSGAEERLKANEAKSMSVSQTLSILGETEPDSATKLMEDPNKAVYVLFHNDLNELSSELKKLDQEVERVKMSGEMSQNSRKETLKSLEESRKQMLLSADALNDALDSAKLQMKNGK